MEWNASSFLENRLFDRRLVKDNLLDKWHHHADIQLGHRPDYRQFLESYVYIRMLLLCSHVLSFTVRLRRIRLQPSVCQ